MHIGIAVNQRQAIKGTIISWKRLLFLLKTYKAACKIRTFKLYTNFGFGFKISYHKYDWEFSFKKNLTDNRAKLARIDA